MIPSPDPVIVPASYETVPTTHIKVSHYPAGAETATPVVVVTLNRPEKQNAFTVQMMEDFEKVYPMFDVDERVKVVVLTGAGKTFCAGADLEIGFDHADRERIMDHRDRIAYEKAKYGFVFARRGITMESSSSFFLPRLIGFSRASYLLTTGDVYPPNSPHFGHLFQETLPDASKVLPRALQLASNIAENVSPMASYLNRALMWHNPGSAEATHLVDSAVLYHMFSARDQKEGVTSFFEKRKPKFQATLEEDAPPNFPWWTEVDTGSRPKAAKGQSKL
ncbi:Enoyl- hydratase isomerase [Neofusicoccum parvum]|uniref:Putative enoyl-hydratase isomerase family protein n=1 Tax=Botryosphaeria parva (strain UCR-NP2) TaxID=1287680 RepID=R1GX82_BOTPV|nr:putative enoyl- hydratase isomerase family protein [Neofusicoccum parvum UCRNP2]GME41870.1 Enoyl- hydratase isomerase [Neofusicoccum parvum]